jgi:cyclopropane-fatty-acyl-phospholipid synthase
MNTNAQTLQSAQAFEACNPPRAAALLLRLLERLEGGRLNIVMPSRDTRTLGRGAHAADMHVGDWAVFGEVLAKGDIGLAESYIDGRWETSDLAGLLALLARNRDLLQRAVYGSAWQLLGYRLAHLLRANTRSGSRRNIAAHYDLGNDFYGLWLDPTMTYSSALFEGDAARSLRLAQRAKYRRILDRLGVRPGEHVLEIGCGWGGLAEVAAQEYGARVTGITLSQRQLEYARERAACGGWSDRAGFELRDYRDAGGRYQHIVSIEMFEAVGERYWPVYFRRLRELLAPGGRAVVQTITIAERHFARYRRGTDFIQRYIFPGGMLPSPEVFAAQARRAGLVVTGDFAFGGDYAHTLRLWHQRFAERAGMLREKGFDAGFQRMWRFYLAYCEAGFRAGSIDVHQFELEKTGR